MQLWYWLCLKIIEMKAKQSDFIAQPSCICCDKWKRSVCECKDLLFTHAFNTSFYVCLRFLFSTECNILCLSVISVANSFRFLVCISCSWRRQRCLFSFHSQFNVACFKKLERHVFFSVDESSFFTRNPIHVLVHIWWWYSHAQYIWMCDAKSYFPTFPHSWIVRIW